MDKPMCSYFVKWEKCKTSYFNISKWSYNLFYIKNYLVDSIHGDVWRWAFV